MPVTIQKYTVGAVKVFQEDHHTNLNKHCTRKVSCGTPIMIWWRLQVAMALHTSNAESEGGGEGRGPVRVRVRVRVRVSGSVFFFLLVVSRGVLTK